MSYVVYVGPRETITDAGYDFVPGIPLRIEDNPSAVDYFKGKRSFRVSDQPIVGTAAEIAATLPSTVVSSPEPTPEPALPTLVQQLSEFIEVRRTGTSGARIEDLPMGLRKQILDESELE